MKSVVMIAYWFPPDGSAGAYRPLRFVRHLPAHGWRASVVAAELGPDGWGRYDPDLLALVPAGTQVVRVRNRDPWQRLQAWRARNAVAAAAPSAAEPAAASPPARLRPRIRAAVQKLEAWCYHPDPDMGWIRPAAAAASEMCARQGASVIWATGGPWSAFVAGARASARTGLPYVLDFRDSWTLTRNEIFEARRPAWAAARDRSTLRRLFARAQAVVLRYETEAECYLRLYGGALDPRKIHLIPNGFEGEVDDSTPPRGDRCTLLYAGTLTFYRWDTLLDAVAELARRDPGRAGRLRIRFVGEENRDVALRAAALGIDGIVEVSGPKSAAEAARLAREAHVLLMLERRPSMKGHELLAGAKLFGYLKAGRPIAGVLPAGEALRILQSLGLRTLAAVDSPQEIRRLLTELVDAWSAGTLARLRPGAAACLRFSAERQSAALARALEGLAALEPFVPGRLEIPASLRADLEPRRPGGVLVGSPSEA